MADLSSLDLTDVDGKAASLTDYAGKPLVIQLARFYG